MVQKLPFFVPRRFFMQPSKNAFCFRLLEYWRLKIARQWNCQFVGTSSWVRWLKLGHTGFFQLQSGKWKVSGFRMLSERHYFEQVRSFLFEKGPGICSALVLRWLPWVTIDFSQSELITHWKVGPVRITPSAFLVVCSTLGKSQFIFLLDIFYSDEIPERR